MSCVGRAAARRNAPNQPRAIRVGPHQGRNKLGLNTGGLSVCFHDTGGLSRDNSPVLDKPQVCQGRIRLSSLHIFLPVLHALHVIRKIHLLYSSFFMVTLVV